MLDDEPWVNARYAEIDFKTSDFARDLVLIAEIDGTPAGLGRLVPLDESSCELGGMLVFESFRGRGVFRALIHDLLRLAGDREVYCVPFADLEAMYTAFGFARCEAAPPAIREKVEWCGRTYVRGVVVMKKG